MKLLFVLEHYYPYIGGAEKLFKSLCEKLAEKNYSINVLTTKYRNKLPEKEIINNVNITRLNVKNRFSFTFFSLFSVLKYAKKTDLIITTSYNAALPAFIAGFLTRKKVIIVFHEVWGKLWFDLPFLSRPQKIAFYLFEQLITHLPFNHYIAVSDFTKIKLIENGVNPKKISRIYNGIDYTEYKTEKSVKKNTLFTYTFFGRLGVSKGIEHILNAVKLFSKIDKESRLKLIIPTYPKNIFKAVKKELRANDLIRRVILKHNLTQEELISELISSDCILIPSYSEGFCFSAVEAIALGLPVISSKNGALQEVISGKHLFIEPFNEEGINKALIKAKAGNWEYKEITKFELETSINSYISLINEMKT